MREIRQIINKIWNSHDRLHNWIRVVWLLQKQLDEIEEEKFRGDTLLNEFADILIIIIRYLDNLGYDPKKVILNRLETRHKGQTEEILEKYEHKWRKENENGN